MLISQLKIEFSENKRQIEMVLPPHQLHYGIIHNPIENTHVFRGYEWEGSERLDYGQ